MVLFTILKPKTSFQNLVGAEMSLEGSTPLSQNPEGNTAVAISDVNDNFNIYQEINSVIKETV